MSAGFGLCSCVVVEKAIQQVYAMISCRSSVVGTLVLAEGDKRESRSAP